MPVITNAYLRALWIYLSIFGLANLALAAEHHKNDKFTSQLKIAMGLYEQNRFAEAIPELEKAYAIKQRPELLYWLGQTHKQLGHLDQALDYLQRYAQTAAGMSATEHSQLHTIIGYMQQALKEGTHPPNANQLTPSVSPSTQSVKLEASHANPPAAHPPTQESSMRGLATEFSRRCSKVLERWIANQEITQAKLFSYLYYPIAETDPPKYHTDWDTLSDRDIQDIEEDIMSRSPAIVFAVMVDKFGYLPTHNQKYSQPLTGNTAVDLTSNRSKRIFNDITGLMAARSEAPFLLQHYQQDTGEIMADLSVPVMVRGVHWGAVRISYQPTK